MNQFRTKLRRFRYWLKHDLFVFDNVVLLVALLFCLAWTWGSISAMSRNWSLAQAITNQRRELALLELEVETLELENEYYASAEYQELAARKYQNKILPGETLVYLPENSVAARTKHSNDAETTTEDTTSNIEQWLQFLFGS